MTGRRRSVLGRTGVDTAGRVDCYECPDCEVTFADWPGNCPRCGYVVVRVVDRRPLSGLRSTDPSIDPSV